MLAHELRGPLGAVSNAIDILQRPQLTREAQDRAIGVARRQIRLAVRLVDDLFDLARLEGSKLQLQKDALPVTKLVQMALDVARPALTAAGVDFEAHIEPEDLTVLVDPVRFVQVMRNLFSNAAKFTPAGGEVRLSCRQAVDSVRIEVRDNGIGMSPDLVARVFDTFAQGADEAGRNRGLGLGLPIARRIVELHGGTITAHSDGCGRGATFTIVVPGREAAAGSS